MKKMFIVESPNKIQKLRKILGEDYMIVASVGHIRSIPKRGLNISIDSDFLPKFEISSGKKEVVNNIKKVASQCEEVIIATDLDREGEAIAYHIYDILPAKDQKKCCRVTFTEITQKAVLDSLKNKREINYKLVDAQKARQKASFR
jgi:DNA topoisomerase-1